MRRTALIKSNNPHLAGGEKVGNFQYERMKLLYCDQGQLGLNPSRLFSCPFFVGPRILSVIPRSSVGPGLGLWPKSVMRAWHSSPVRDR
jgi:hypothetical protein